jgi:hypothetical protein
MSSFGRLLAFIRNYFKTIKFTTVKIASLILSLVVLLLSITPCCSEDRCDDEKLSETTEGHTEEFSVCSPFLTCGTCVGFTFQNEAYKFKTVPVNIRKHQIPNSEFYIDCQDSKIWQPPKIS